MTKQSKSTILIHLIKGILVSVGIVVFLLLISSVYLLGYFNGVNRGSVTTEATYLDLFKILNNKIKVAELSATPSPTPTETDSRPVEQASRYNWGGPELWEEVNKKRLSYGVGALSIREELCTIASLRLNELLERGSLDGHEGFGTLSDRRPDLKWIFEKYAISEFLVQGAQSAMEAVDLWDNTLGHKKLLTGGEYVYGCIYAQNSFGVAIAAYE